MMNTEVGLSLRIVGDFDPDEVSKKLNISASKQWRRGTPINKRINYDCDGWVYSFSSLETLFVDIQMNNLLSVFSSRVNDFNELRDMYNLMFCIDIVIRIKNQEIPSVFFDSKVLDFTQKIGATIDIDMYLE